jgi:signal transduction histidine kinase
VGIAAVSTAMPAGPVLGDYLFPMGFAVAAWGAGRTVRHRSRLSAEMHEAALRAEESHRERSARAVAEERRRIAREVHDVLAHSVSVMVVQAGGARRILDRDPARAAEAARLIEQTGRAALREMRGLLGVLPEEGDGPLAPQPTLADLEALADRARAAGLEVNLRTEGEARGLPAGAEVAVYRVVQEALTNAMKHAPGARAYVALRWEPGTLEIAISDGGAVGGARRPGLPGAGQGIVGMRERLKVYGGTVSALPRPGGGFLVRARLPLVDEHAATTPREAVL